MPGFIVAGAGGNGARRGRGKSTAAGQLRRWSAPKKRRCSSSFLHEFSRHEPARFDRTGKGLVAERHISIALRDRQITFHAPLKTHKERARLYPSPASRQNPAPCRRSNGTRFSISECCYANDRYGELRMRVKQVLVFISAATARATAIPPELVSRMHRFSAQAEQSPPQRKKSRANVQRPKKHA